MYVYIYIYLISKSNNKLFHTKLNYTRFLSSRPTSIKDPSDWYLGIKSLSNNYIKDLCSQVFINSKPSIVN